MFEKHRSFHLLIRFCAVLNGFAFTLIAFLLACPLADGAIVGTSGAIAVIAPPPSVAEGQLRSDINVVVFPEEQGKTLAKALDMDVTVPGLYATESSPDLSPGTIPKGTVIFSYYLHADSLSAFAGHPVIFDGTITFDAPVLGIDVLSPSLDAGINRLGAFDVFYPFGVANSGLEIKQGADGFALDRLTLSADRRTVSIRWQNVGTRSDAHCDNCTGTFVAGARLRRRLGPVCRQPWPETSDLICHAKLN